MQLKKILLLFCLFLFPEFYSAHLNNEKIYVLSAEILQGSDSDVYILFEQEKFTFSKERPIPLLQLFHTKQKKNKKLVAAFLAFPFPFGIVGLHRIYLGCAPYVPVVYIATFGGALGLLPLIDFCFILSDKQTDAYINNKKVFMWVN